MLSHGFGGSARNFRPQLRDLSGDHEVVVYDTRGHARSAAPAQADEYTKDELVADLGRVVSSARTPAVVGGLSLGAYTALEYTLAHREQVRGLVLASFPSTAPGSARTEWALGFAEAIERDGLERAGERYVWGEGSRFDEGARAFIRRGLLEHAPHALTAILRHVLAAIPTPDELAGRLAELELPVAIIVGGEDTSALAPCERLAALLPQAELHVVPAAGHVVNLAAPAEFNRLLAEFVRCLPPA